MSVQRQHLKAIVAIWLTNGNNPVDGANDTRYDLSDFSWELAADCTDSLIDKGYVKRVMGSYEVVPTPLGIFEAIS